MVIECFGYKFHTDFMKKNFAQSLAPNGQIFVNDLLQVSGVDPSYEPHAPALKENIFALGDVNLTSLKEEKDIMNINHMTPYVVQNIFDLANKRRPSGQLPNSLPFTSFISLGPNYALQMINGMIKLDPKAGSMKSHIALSQIQILSGDKEALR